MAEIGLISQYCRKKERRKKMLHKTKYLPGVLFSLLFICMIHVNAVTASTNPSLSASADNASIRQGDYVSISIGLKNNPQISTLGMSLNYDSSILKYDSSSWSESFSGSDMTMASDTGDAVNLSAVCDDSYSADGTVVTVRFLASKNASSIPVRLVLRDMADADLSEVSNCSVTSMVNVSKTANTEIEGSEPNEEDLDTSVATVSRETATQQEVHISNASTGNVQRTSQSESSAVSAPASGSSKADENYQTGAGIGSDIFLIAAVICGIFALIMAARTKGENE